ncbi:unnamed protein product [Nippostrongylus brasiliensis]|uniref:Dynein regulatory complex protein 10 n=1 Tax=Nippostrongylus brasiliensis TaxID=27835 RepID=A0A0N4XXS8_NIPBR|nr:unnamed protein product [Nippostrongylus brasiliensis]
MMTNETDIDYEYLSSWIHNPHQNWDRVQQELNNTLKELNNQLRIATVGHLHWNHVKNEEIYTLAPPVSKILRIGPLLRTARTVREKMSRLTHKYVAMNLIYRRLAPGGSTAAENLNVEALRVIKLLQEHKTTTDRDIEDMDKELEKSEKVYRATPCAVDTEHVHAMFRTAFDTLASTERKEADKRFAELQSMMDKQSEEISRLKDQLQSQTRKEEEPPKEVNMEIEVNNDDTYFKRMVEEVQDDDNPTPPPKLASDGNNDDDNEEDKWTVRSENFTDDENLQDEPMEEANQRKELTIYEQLQQDELRVQELEEQKHRLDEEQRNTSFDDLIPFDGGHNTALCNIPDKKNIAEERINERKKQLDEEWKNGIRVIKLAMAVEKDLEEARRRKERSAAACKEQPRIKRRAKDKDYLRA